MPTLRLVYLTEQQYAGMTDHAHAHGAANNITTAEEQQLPSISNQEQTTRLVPIADATRNASSSKKSDHEEDNVYLDTVLQESIDAVNSRTCSFGRHAVRYQQVQQEMALSSDEDSKNDSTSSERVRVRVRVVDALQQFQDEKVSSGEEIENDSTCTSSVHLDAIQRTSGNKRKRRAPIQSFDDRFNDLMAFKAKYSHCDVSQHGEDPSLGAWCNELRRSYKKIQNNQKPKRKISDERIQRLNDAGFNWSLNSDFDDHFNDLMTFKGKYGHCDVSCAGENASLGTWCIELRGSHKKIQNNQKPKRKISDERIQRLNDAGFKWSLNSNFDDHLNDLMSFKAKYGHCDVPRTGENASLGTWCIELRRSYKKIQNNQKPRTKLSDEQIQHLNDAGFNWSLEKLASCFDKRFNGLMAFKAKYGHCDVSQLSENASLGTWCSELKRSYKKIQNNQKPRTKLSDEQIQRLNDAGFKWCR
jgi:hypothetical protein